MFNACALLHFPDLSIQYISDCLGFNTVEDFHRVFKRYMQVSVREYQTENIGSGIQMQIQDCLLYTSQCADQKLIDGFDRYLQEFQKVLHVERTAVEAFFDN